MKIVGYRVIDFTKDGKQFKFVKVFVQDDTPVTNQVGFSTNSFNVRMDLLDTIEQLYKSGKKIKVYYNQYQKVDTIVPLM